MDPNTGAAILAHLLVRSPQPPAQEPETSRGGEAGAVSTEPESEAGAVSPEPVRWVVFISAVNYK